MGSWGASLPEPVAFSDRSGLAVGVTTTKRNGTGWTVETQAGLSDNHLSADWSTRLLGVKVKIGATASPVGQLTGFVDGDGKITTSIRGGITLSAELGGGIIVRLR